MARSLCRLRCRPILQELSCTVLIFCRSCTSHPISCLPPFKLSGSGLNLDDHSTSTKFVSFFESQTHNRNIYDLFIKLLRFFIAFTELLVVPSYPPPVAGPTVICFDSQPLNISQHHHDNFALVTYTIRLNKVSFLTVTSGLSIRINFIIAN